MMTTTRVSDAGLRFIAQEEGRVLKPYRDVAGYWTIGVGHLLTPVELESGSIPLSDRVVAWRQGITAKDSSDILQQDVAWAEAAVNGKVGVMLKQNEFDALVSFVFNIGVGAFGSSTLLKKLNTRAFAEVPVQMRRWVYAGGQRVAGLANRRNREGTLFTRGYG